MAQPANLFTSAQMVGIREDLSDAIDMITPDKTPFFSKCKKMAASNTLTEWQTDALRASADNAHPEGDDTLATAATPTVRLGNYTQIFKEAVVIPGTDEGLTKAGRGSEMARQIFKKTKELKLDIERALFANTARSNGAGDGKRRLGGVPSWINTNTAFEAGGADPTGDGTNVRTNGTTPVAFSQARFDTVMQAIWTAGGDPSTVYLNPFQMNLATGFVGNNAQRNTTKTGTVVEMIDLYVTSYGTVQFMLSREHRARDVFIIQDDKWAIATFRGMKNEPLAKTGDAERRQIVTELTLCSMNEAASGGVFDNTTA